MAVAECGSSLAKALLGLPSAYQTQEEGLWAVLVLGRSCCAHPWLGGSFICWAFQPVRYTANPAVTEGGERQLPQALWRGERSCPFQGSDSG